MSESRTRAEVEATVADYFHMLTMDLAGRKYSKTSRKRRILDR